MPRDRVYERPFPIRNQDGYDDVLAYMQDTGHETVDHTWVTVSTGECVCEICDLDLRDFLDDGR
ncbi:MAG TPA: hypothetical protein VH482_05220 [Thermomicrobiales bacterium]|jgi:hypothetical protein